MNSTSKSSRELYGNIRSELIGIHYRLLLIRQLFSSQDTNDLLNKTAIRFFNTLKWDLLNTISISISRLTDSAKSFNKYNNASLQQLISSLDSISYPELFRSLRNILAQIKAKSSRIEDWRKKWAAHRDLDVVHGSAPKPVTSLNEIDEVVSLIRKFLNEFEDVFQDGEINLYGKSDTEVKNIADNEQLRIKHEFYENMIFPDDGNTIVEIIKQANHPRIIEDNIRRKQIRLSAKSLSLISKS